MADYRTAAVVFTAAWMAAPLALAAPAGGPPTSAPVVRAMIACRAIADNAQRLACFDKTAADVEAADKSGELISLDREQRRTVRRQAFGFQLPAFTLFDRGEKPEEADRLTATIASVSQGAGGRWTLKFDDGAVWRQTDDNDLYPAPHAGSKAVVRRGMVGSFFISIDGKPEIRAARVS